MTGREPGDLPTSHVIARILLSGLITILFVAALTLVVLRGGDERAVARMISDGVKNWLLP
jgi:hypothetical protein